MKLNQYPEGFCADMVKKGTELTKYYNVLPDTYNGLNLCEALLSQGCPNAFFSYATVERVDLNYI